MKIVVINGQNHKGSTWHIGNLLTNSFSSNLRQRDGIIESFDEELWYAIVESVTICSGNDAIFTFKNGSKIFVNTINK